jgi:hypothetical protein
MADYFTNFSLVVKLPNQEAQKAALKIAGLASAARQGDEVTEDLPESLREFIEGWDFETESDHNNGIWLHSHHGGIDAVCSFIRHLLQKFDPDGCVVLEWSNDCSKPRLDAYGGGAAIITAKRIKSMNTCQWIQNQAARFNAHKPTRQTQPLNTN